MSTTDTDAGGDAGMSDHKGAPDLRRTEHGQSLWRLFNKRVKSKFHTRLVEIIYDAMEHDRRRCAVQAVCCPCYMCARPSRRQGITRTLGSIWYSTLHIILSVYIIVSDDVLRAFLTKEADIYFTLMSSFAFCVFFVDLVLQSTARRKFVYTFFWWLDLAATASILIDLPVVVEASQQSAGGVLFVGVAAQAGTRAGRIIRVLRVVRLLRIVRLVKMWKVRRAQTAKIESLRRRAKRRRSALLASAVSGAGSSVAESVLHSVRLNLARTQSMAAEQSAKYKAGTGAIAPAPMRRHGTGNRLMAPERMPTMGEGEAASDEDVEAPRTTTAGFTVNHGAVDGQPLVPAPSSPTSPTPSWSMAPKSLRMSQSDEGPVFVNSKAPRRWSNDHGANGSHGQFSTPGHSNAVRKRAGGKRRRGTLVSLSLAKSIKNMRDKLHQVKAQDQESTISDKSVAARRMSTLIEVKMITGVIMIMMILPLMYYEAPSDDLTHELKLLATPGLSDTTRDALVASFVTDHPNTVHLEIHGVLLRSDPARAASVRSSELTDYAVEGGKLTLDWSAERASEGLWGFLRTNIIIILLGVQAASVSKDIDNVLIKPMDAVTSFLRPAMNQALDNATEERAIWLGRRDGPDFFTRLLLLTLQSLTDNLNPEAKRTILVQRAKAKLREQLRTLSNRLEQEFRDMDLVRKAAPETPMMSGSNHSVLAGKRGRQPPRSRAAPVVALVANSDSFMETPTAATVFDEHDLGIDTGTSSRWGSRSRVRGGGAGVPRPGAHQARNDGAGVAQGGGIADRGRAAGAKPALMGSKAQPNAGKLPPLARPSTGDANASSGTIPAAGAPAPASAQAPRPASAQAQPLAVAPTQPGRSVQVPAPAPVPAVVAAISASEVGSAASSPGGTVLSLPRYASIDNAIQTLGFNIDGELTTNDQPNTVPPNQD